MDLGSDGIRAAIERFLPLSFKVVNTAAEAFKNAERRCVTTRLATGSGGSDFEVARRPKLVFHSNFLVFQNICNLRSSFSGAVDTTHTKTGPHRETNATSEVLNYPTYLKKTTRFLITKERMCQKFKCHKNQATSSVVRYMVK